MGLNSKTKDKNDLTDKKPQSLKSNLLLEKLKSLEMGFPDSLFDLNISEYLSQKKKSFNQPFKLFPFSGKDIIGFNSASSGVVSEFSNNKNEQTPHKKQPKVVRPKTTSKAKRRVIRFQNKKPKSPLKKPPTTLDKNPNNSQNSQTPRILTRRAKRMMQSVKVGKEKCEIKFKNKTQRNPKNKILGDSSDFSDFFELAVFGTSEEKDVSSARKLMPRRQRFLKDGANAAGGEEMEAAPLLDGLKREAAGDETMTVSGGEERAAPTDEDSVFTSKAEEFLKTPKEIKIQSKFGKLAALPAFEGELGREISEIAKRGSKLSFGKLNLRKGLNSKKGEKRSKKGVRQFFLKRRKFEIPALIKAKKLREAEERKRASKIRGKSGRKEGNVRINVSEKTKNAAVLVGRPLRVISKIIAPKKKADNTANGKPSGWLKTKNSAKTISNKNIKLLNKIPKENPQTPQIDNGAKEILRMKKFTPNNSFSGDELRREKETPSWAKSSALKDVLKKQQKDDSTIFPPLDCPIINLTDIFETITEEKENL